ncbi:DUF1127 domain-containing protein [Rhodovibrio salinarum]|uniref:DUF1127 domain-containing protein n=1 Tax=Rhodovibrio salinarum TaxID=1087 RepID=A0A934V2D4_9PROT|nr:DUF1127 domain-containing protein [Rhodovibrio salinarum]MBK1699041.1 DUF1127 domain-containing protein [Rhodovibrio salinarum]
MARLTDTERDLIQAARQRGPHPLLQSPPLHELTAAQLRRYAEAERARYLAPILAGAANRIIDAVRRKRVERETRRALMELSDRVLEDIGMRRAEIPERAKQRARQSVQPRQAAAPKQGAARCRSVEMDHSWPAHA